MKRTALLLLATTALFLGACTANTEESEGPAAVNAPSLEVASPAQEAREAARIHKPVVDPTMKLKLRAEDPTTGRRPSALDEVESQQIGETIVKKPKLPIEMPSADPTMERAPAASDLVADDTLDPSETRAPALDELTNPPGPQTRIKNPAALRDMQNGSETTLCADCR